MKILFKHIICAVVAATSLLLMACDAPANSDQKIVIYQIFTRLFGSDNPDVKFDGELSVNGVGKFDDFTLVALDSIRAMGITHVWYTGVVEHATIYSVDSVGGIQMNHPGVIKGKAGSPYAIKDYYDVNAYLANSVDQRMAEFEALVSRTHRAGMGVIIDFVPNHVARGYHSDMAPEGVVDLGAEDNCEVAFSANNNFYYIPSTPLTPSFETAIDCPPYVEFPAKVTGNDVFSASPRVDDWYETVKINYGVDYQNGRAEHFDPIPDTWFKMRDILLYWAGKGVDGFRCDMAEMTPCAFWQWAIASVKRQHPNIIFIAEIYNPEAYEDYIVNGGFDYLYDKVGLYDTLKAIIQGRASTQAISHDRAKIAAVQPYMLNFLENHDEQRIAWHEFAGSAEAGLPMMAISTLSDNIPMMIYFGQELGEESAQVTGFSGADGRTTIFDFWTLPLYQAWRNGGAFDGGALPPAAKKLRSDYTKLLKLAQQPLFIDGKFVDITLQNPEVNDKICIFARATNQSAAIVVSNLSDNSATASYTLPEQLHSMKLSRVLFDTHQSSSSVNIDNNNLKLTLSPYQAIVIEINQ